MSWLSQNGLALYGAVTGSTAIAISYFSYRHNVGRDKIRLAVSHRNHPQQAENIARLNDSGDSDKPWNQPSIVEIYEVVVRNLGSVPAPLDDVGIVDSQGTKHGALVSRRVSHMGLLEPIAKSDTCILAPRTSAKFSVYLRRDEQLFQAAAAYVVDQTGREWRTRA
jgi:hypothetical protein